MNNRRKWTITLDNVPTIAAWLVFALTIIAFALSFDALRDVANSNGKTAWRSIFWPVLIDGGLVIFSIAVLRANLLSERAWGRWGLVALATGLTVYFNLIHAETNVNARIVAVVPPVVLFFGFETLVGMLKSNAKRARQAAGQVDSAEQVARLEAELAEAGRAIEISQHRIDGLITDRDKAVQYFEVTQVELEKEQAYRQHVEQQLTDTQAGVDEMRAVVDAAQAIANQAQAWELLSATAKAEWIALHTNGDRPPAAQLAAAVSPPRLNISPHRAKTRRVNLSCGIAVNPVTAPTPPRRNPNAANSAMSTTAGTITGIRSYCRQPARWATGDKCQNARRGKACRYW